MANWWDDPDLQSGGNEEAPKSNDDTWGHFMKVIGNSLGRGAATAIPYILDIASLNSRVPQNPKKALTGQGKITTAVNKKYSEIAGDVQPRNKAEEYGSAIAQGVGSAAVPLGPVAGIPRALLGGAVGGAAAQAAHDIAPDNWWAPVLAGLAGGTLGAEGPHIVSSVKTGRMIHEGMQHPDWQAVNDVIVNDLEGGGTLANPKVSSKGAVGPQQVMPETARKPGFGIRPWDGKTQADLARVGRQYSAAMMHKYDGDAAKVLAAYNAGPGRVDSLLKKYGEDWASYLPPETKNYVKKGLSKLGLHGSDRYQDAFLQTLDDAEFKRYAGIVDETNQHEDWAQVWKRAEDDYIPELDDPITPEERAANDEETAFLDNDEHLDLNDDFFIETMGKKFDLDRNYKPTTAEQERMTEIQQERPDFYWGNFGYRKGDELSNVHQFPGERIVNPDKVGPSETVPYNLIAAKKNGISNIGDARAERYRRQMDENNRRLKEYDDNYLDSLQERADNLNYILEEHLANNPLLSSGELEDLKQSWFELHNRMKSSKMPALGQDIVNDAVQNIMKFEKQRVNPKDLPDIILDPESSPVVRKQEVAPLDVRAVPEKNKPANEHNRTIVQLLKDLWNDESGAIDPDGIFGRKPSNHILNPKPELTHEETRMSSYSADGKTVPAIRVFDKNTGETFAIARATPFENKESRIARAYKAAKAMLADDSGSGPNPFDGETPEGRDGSDHTPVDKLRQALRDAQPIRDVQETMYSRARSKRFSEASDVGKKTKGEEGLYAEMGALKGALPKANYESIRGQFSQEDLDGLFDHIKNSSRLSYGESIRARVAFAKMIGDRDANYATVPTDSEIQLLGKVFPKEVIEELLRKKPLKDRVIHNIVSGLNVPRSLMASMDLSAPFRQGVFLVGRKEFWTSFDDMFKAFGSEKAFQAIQDEISSRPTYRLMKKGRLALSGADHVLYQREEAFMSDLAEKIPVAGRLVRASTRAYEGFLNKLRADTFDRMVKLSKDAGIDIEHDQRALKDITRFINAATGRGDLGKLNQAAPILSAAFFSPRLAASRIQMLTDPRIYMASNPVVRKEAIKSLMAFVAIQVAGIGLLSMATGGSVNVDPRSSDFAKIKVGNTRIDTLGGFQQYIRLAAVLATGKEVGSNGKVRKLNDDKAYKGDTYASVVGRFARGKESPVASFIHDNAAGKDIVGKKVKYPEALYDRFIPLVAQDVRDVAKEKGYPAAAALGTMAVFGVGLQTYETKKGGSKKQLKNWWEDSSLSSHRRKKEWWEQ